MSERAYTRLSYGEPVFLSEMSRNGNDLIQVLWELNNEKTTGQYKKAMFEGEHDDLLLNRLNPIPRPLTAEQKHFYRDKTNPPTDQEKLSLCRAELAQYGK